MQHKAVYLLFCKLSLHVSSVNYTHHQEYKKTVTKASGTVQLSPSNVPKLTWLHSTGGCTYSFVHS